MCGERPASRARAAQRLSVVLVSRRPRRTARGSNTRNHGGDGGDGVDPLNRPRPSALDSRQIKSAETVWISQDIDLNDLTAGDREADDGKQPAVRAARHKPQLAVDENKLIGQTALRERRRLSGDRVSPSHDA